MERHEKSATALTAINKTLAQLLGPEGCPWDRAQTPDTLCNYMLEEMYELVDAIRNGSVADQLEELGDVMFILLMIAQFQEQAGNFSLADVFDAGREKMIRRHPHVFGAGKYINQEELSKTWEQIKKQEKEGKEQKGGIFASLPVALAPLMRAYRIHSKSAGVSFTWDSDEAAEQQVEAEWLEWLDACQNGDEEAQEHELGDLIFSIVEVGRRKGIKAAAALDKTNNRFLRRFEAMESLATERGLDFFSLDQASKDELWGEIKAREDKDK